MKRIAILTCSNTTQDLACASFQCLSSLRQAKDKFAGYADTGAELVGIIGCAGCPTAVAPEKVLKRVRSLAALNLDALHLSTCMIHLCPFRNKYKKIIKEYYPDILIVEGTHSPREDLDPDSIKEGFKALLTQPHKTIIDVTQQD